MTTHARDLRDHLRAYRLRKVKQDPVLVFRRAYRKALAAQREATALVADVEAAAAELGIDLSGETP